MRAPPVYRRPIWYLLRRKKLHHKQPLTETWIDHLKYPKPKREAIQWRSEQYRITSIWFRPENCHYCLTLSTLNSLLNNVDEASLYDKQYQLKPNKNNPTLWFTSTAHWLPNMWEKQVKVGNSTEGMTLLQVIDILIDRHLF